MAGLSGVYITGTTLLGVQGTSVPKQYAKDIANLAKNPSFQQLTDGMFTQAAAGESSLPVQERYHSEEQPGADVTVSGVTQRDPSRGNGGGIVV